MSICTGHETSASALTWACYLLAKAPDVQSRVNTEVRLQIAGRTMTQPYLKLMALTCNVFKETLQLFSPVGFMARESAKTYSVRDKTVP